MVCLGGRNGSEESPDGVEGAVGVVGGKGGAMCPCVADVLTLRQETTFGLTEGFAEHVVPLLPHVLEKAVEVVP